jgi:hypothetical protein
MWNLTPLEISSNLRSKVSGVCGNFNNNVNDDFYGENDNKISPVDNAFYGHGLVDPPQDEVDQINPDLWNVHFNKKPCEGEQLVAGQLYKRDESSSIPGGFLDSSSVHLMKREDGDVEVEVSEIEAKTTCTEAKDQNENLNMVLELVDHYPILVESDEDFLDDLNAQVETSITDCITDVMALGLGAVQGFICLL